MANCHFGSKWGGYIHWTAFSAFWVSVWICALSPLTLCSFKAGKKGISKGWRWVQEARREENKEEQNKNERVNKGRKEKHKAEEMGRESRWEGKKTVTPVNEERQRATSWSQKDDDEVWTVEQTRVTWKSENGLNQKEP